VGHTDLLAAPAHHQQAAISRCVFSPPAGPISSRSSCSRNLIQPRCRCRPPLRSNPGLSASIRQTGVGNSGQPALHSSQGIDAVAKLKLGIAQGLSSGSARQGEIHIGCAQSCIRIALVLFRELVSAPETGGCFVIRRNSMRRSRRFGAAAVWSGLFPLVKPSSEEMRPALGAQVPVHSERGR